MEINRLLKMISATTLAGIMFVGCGGGSSSAPAGPTVLTGTFVDAPVQGLHYKTATQEGYTDATGGFKYIAGENVEFKLGNLLLGSVSADALITPYTLAGDTDISNPSSKAINIALLLQNFDADHNDVILDISKLKDMDLSKDFSLSDTPAANQNKIQAKFATPSFLESTQIKTPDLITVTNATNAMKDYVTQNGIKYSKKFTQEYLDQVVFYSIETEIDGKTYSPFIQINKFREGISYGDDSAAYGESPRFENWGTYTIENGILKGVDSNGTTHYIKITAVGDGYIEGEIDGNSGIWYTDKTKAQAALLSSTSSSISVATGFTQAYLDQVVFYTIENTDGNDKPVTPYILVRKFRDGIFYGDDSGTPSGSSGFENWGNYTIENGVIKLTDSAGVEHEQIKVTAVSDDYVEGSITYNGQTQTVKFYTDKSKAQAALSGSTTPAISVATGFTAEYLNGKTLWTVDASGSQKVMTTFTFTNNTLTYGSPWSGSVSYTIMNDGIIDTIETNDNTGHEYYKIVDVEGTKISLCEGENLTNVKSCTIAKQWLFTKQTDAQAFLDSL